MEIFTDTSHEYIYFSKQGRKKDQKEYIFFKNNQIKRQKNIF